MTRDTHGVVGGDHDVQTEAFSALWTAIPSFPRLPPDAPQELGKLTVDVNDPRRVYSIYRASRRHGFQILVERYIIQLRYGCQDPHCAKPTCFTCRRRLAGMTPLRRYNTTSARTLACFLASQDNPERGLCQNTGTPPAKTTSHGRLRASSKSTTTAERAKIIPWTVFSPERLHNSGGDLGSGQPSPASVDSTFSARSHLMSKFTTEELERLDEYDDIEHVRSAVRVLEEPVKRDHKSFVQNLFGTIAFRMLEWLTPKSLEAMISSNTQTQYFAAQEYKAKLEDSGRIKCPASAHSEQPCGPQGSTESDAAAITTPNSISGLSTTVDGPLSGSGTHLDDKMNKQNATPGTKQHRRPHDLADPQSLHLASVMHMNGSATHDAKDRAFLELGASKTEHLNGQIKQPDEADPQKPTPTENQGTIPTVKAHRRFTLANPKPPAGKEEASYHGDPQYAIPQNPRRVSISKVVPPASDGEAKQTERWHIPNDQLKKPQQHLCSDKTTKRTDTKALPQSLSILPLEVIDLLSDILEGDRIQGLNFAHPLSPYPKGSLRRVGDIATQSQPESSSQILFKHSSNTEPQWRLFIEQSLFYVLSSPKALLQSFSDERQYLTDTQTLWYCMMRLIRVASSTVFDCLWIAAADLYVPPRELWPILDWAKKARIYDAHQSVDYTTDRAARLMSICLHALIAAVPYVQDSAHLFSISGTRSNGLCTSQGRGLSAESINLCLTYDDVFSNELALRLARRLFAAIPARRQYQEILGLDESGYTGPSSPSDILDIVLAPLNFLDIEVPPILNFTPEDRELHEKRAPTLLIDWARTVMLQDWTGGAEVPADGSFGGALAMIAAIYDKRKSLLLDDVHFRTDYFADRLDPLEMPVEWLSFTTNKKTIHLLDYPYLFSPATLVTYFRAINFSRMNRSFDAATSMMERIRTTIASGTLTTDTGRRENLLGRLRTATSQFLVLQIRRNNVLVDAFNHLWRREERELLRPLKIRLGEDSGEEGSDSGGVQQEFFRLAIAEALNPDYGTFTIDERTRMTWFQPGSPEPLWKFELIGLIISLAIYNGLTLPVTFPKSLYRKLLGSPVMELDHIEDGWPDLASGLTTLLEWDEKDGSVSDIFSRTYEFSIESFGRQISLDMTAGSHWPQFNEPAGSNPVGVRLVDSENRTEYVSDYIQWLTNISIRPQFEAFRRGFFTCLDRRSLSLFDPDILQSVVEGVQEIDILELRRYARYVGWDATHRTIKDFWSIVKKFGTDEKRKLLEFVTASDRVPVGGMRNLQFVIQRNGVGDIDGHLPTSYTCYGTLLLPEYSGKEVLREKLGMALENAKGFGFA